MHWCPQETMLVLESMAVLGYLVILTKRHFSSAKMWLKSKTRGK